MYLLLIVLKNLFFYKDDRLVIGADLEYNLESLSIINLAVGVVKLIQRSYQYDQDDLNDQDFNFQLNPKMVRDLMGDINEFVKIFEIMEDSNSLKENIFSKDKISYLIKVVFLYSNMFTPRSDGDTIINFYEAVDLVIYTVSAYFSGERFYKFIRPTCQKNQTANVSIKCYKKSNTSASRYFLSSSASNERVFFSIKTSKYKHIKDSKCKYIEISKCKYIEHIKWIY